jgi:NAD dependent epimerase/dehydratase family enzyme
MHRWHILAIPEWAIRAGLGEAGRELLLPDQRVVPERLIADGFVFAHPTIGSAISAVWG